MPGTDGGALDGDRLAWVADRLAEDTTPTVLAMHHPPVDTGILAMDEIGIPAADRAALGEVLAASPHVRRVISGHVHRAATAMLGDCPVVLCPSAERQLALDLAGGDDVEFTAGPPGLHGAHLEGRRPGVARSAGHVTRMTLPVESADSQRLVVPPA